MDKITEKLKMMGMLWMYDMNKKMEEIDDARQQEERDGDAYIGHFHRLGLLQPVGDLLRRAELRQLRRSQYAAGEDQEAAELGCEGGAQRIESLGEVEPAGRALRVSEQAHIGVGRHLQQCDAGGQHEQGREEHTIRRQHCRRVEQEFSAERMAMSTPLPSPLVAAILPLRSSILSMPESFRTK